MARQKSENHFIKGAVYPGGQKAMLLFIQNNLQYPPEAIAAKVEGTVRIRFSIDHTGKVFKSQVIASLGHGCDEEAIRLVHLLQFEVSKAYKLKVQHHRTLNIHFKLQVNQDTSSEATSPPAPLSIQYSISSSTSPEAPTSVAGSSNQGYHYTIQLKP
ncbi:MAG: energy transducer TonB [Haliscomenobacter sp.]|uniref:energy transducer TonB n=1 Tax=Haliscomenobacter sp. TaxID=2717303 RepID=UPI0029A1ADBC|nr:energy transducer TonB [Haliscomenobacter sp.]MDX2069100.1 energy transducer TonB [Haliscomenobacter sp.]